MDRRTFLKCGLGGFSLVCLDPFLGFSRFFKREDLYGINLTRRMHNERIIDPRILDILDEMNINDVSVHIGMFQKKIYSNRFTYEINGRRAVPDDSYVLDCIERLKSRNKRITLKPAVYVLDNRRWRGKINPDNSAIWFSNYEEMIMHYLRLTKEFNIESLCIGTELNNMQRFDEKWSDLIKNVRKDFNGKVTYCANWNAYKDVNFFNDLDYISISAYFPLADNNEVLTLENLINAWNVIGNDLRRLFNKFKKDIVFGEIGYRSVKGTARQSLDLKQVDYEEQRMCYKALDYVIRNRVIPVKKVYLWVDETHDLNDDKIGFGIFSKPVEKDIRIYSKF